MECIICRRIKEKNEFSKEHIIPESLGNKKYILDNVCKECNDKLGSKVDCELVGFEPFFYPRIKLDLRGKSGSLPKMFKNATLEDGRPAFTKYNKLKDKLEINPPPKIKFTKQEEKLRCKIESSSSKETVKALKIKYRRTIGEELPNKVEEEVIKELRKASIAENVKVNFKMEIDTLKIGLAFMKIAYELIFYLELLDKDMSEYLEDNRLKEISNVISDYIYYNKKPINLPILNKTLNKDLQEELKYLSSSLFNHQYCHSVSICSCKDKKTIIYRINLLNSLNYYIEIRNINCKIFNKTIYIDPLTVQEFIY